MTQSSAIPSVSLIGDVAPDFPYSTDPGRPDYACPAYRDMAPRWQIVKDARESTPAYLRQHSLYLPKFESESLEDYAARLNMTFAEDTYSETIEEHTGLVFAEPLKLDKDVPQEIKDLCEDIDGEGNHIDVFAHSALDSAFHFGHVVLYTDYPVTDAVKTRGDKKKAKIRPYAVLYHAPDVFCWEPVVVGGVQVLKRVMFREKVTDVDGTYGVKEVERFREVKQEVFYDEFTGRPKSLGAITYQIYRRATVEEKATGGGADFVPLPDTGVIGGKKGPDRIPARVVYGGEKLGLLHTKPHLFGLAYAELETVQVKSDYANVMHKTNVPTPIFSGVPQKKEGDKAVMGQGFWFQSENAKASMLEPSGAAISETRARLSDIRSQKEKKGASFADGSKSNMTAAESRMRAAQKNAKIRKGAKSLQDALEGVLADFAAFMGIAKEGSVKSGGSVQVNQNYAGIAIDPAYLTVLVAMYKEGTISMEDLRAAAHTGQLPDTFDANDTQLLHMIADEIARQEAAELAAKNQPPIVRQEVAA